MADKKRKDPAFANESEFDDDFMSSLDNFDSELAGFDTDTEDFDSEKDRKPAGKLAKVAAHMGVLGKAAGGGAAAGIAERLKHDMPDLSRLVGDSVDLASETMRLKNDVMTEMRPTINQTKILGRQLLRYVKDVVPQKPYEALMSALETPEEQRDTAPSKEEARKTQQEQILSNIFKTQMKERMLDRRREAVDKLISDKVTASRHHELASMTLDIRNQAIFQTNFTRSVMTAYMRKNLELSYRRMYLAEDTLEALKMYTQMAEKRLDAIRHNTGLPDSQKIHLKEIAMRNTKEKIMGSLQESLGKYASGIFGRIREQWIDPAKEMLGSTNDALSMLVDQLQMGEEFGEKFDVKKTLLGSIGGLLGKGIGRLGGQKLLAKMNPETKKLLANYAKMGKPGIIMLAEALRRGEIEGHEDLGRFLDSILPETDMRGGGTFTNTTYQNPEAPGAITKKFTTTVETIIPGYLRMQTALLQKLATGRSEEMSFDFKKGEFVTTGELMKSSYKEIMGDEEQRAAMMQGTANYIRKELMGVGTKKAMEFEDIAEEVTLVLQNLAMAGRMWGTDGFFPLEDLEQYSTDPEADTEWGETAFRGIKGHMVQSVATFLLSIMTHIERDGSRSINFPVRTALQARVMALTQEVNGKHKAAVEKLLSMGYSDQLKKAGILESGYGGNFQMTNKAYYGAYQGFDRDKLTADAEYYGTNKSGKGARFDDLGRLAKEETFLEEQVRKLGEGPGLGERLKSMGRTAEGYIASAAEAAGLKEEYGEFKEWLNESFEDICAWMKEKKQAFDKLVTKVKKTVSMKAYQFLMYTDMDGAKVFAEAFFDVKKKELKPLKKAPNVKRFKLLSADFRVPPTLQLVNYLARYSSLHRFMKMIHNAADRHPVAWVLDSMLPDSLIILAELTEEEIQDILDGPDPAKELEAKMKGEIAEAARKTREWVPHEVNGRMQYGDPSAVIPMSGPQAPILALPMGPSEEELRKEAASFKRQMTAAKNKGQMNKYEMLRERARLHGHNLGEDTEGKTFLPKPTIPRAKKQNKKAEGGIIDWYGGDPVGTIKSPHLLAGGGALAGEHGKEVIVPLNRNQSSVEAYLQAKAFHERDGERYAAGGVAGWDGSRLKGAAKFLDRNLRRAGRGLASMLRNTNLQSKDYQDKLDSLADTLEAGAKGAKVEQRTKRARNTVLKAYKDLQKLTDKSTTVQYAKAIKNLLVAAATDDGLDEIPPADRRLIKRIKKCLAEKDFTLSNIKSINKDTTHVLKKAVQIYQETAGTVDEKIDQLSEFYEEQKKAATEKYDAFMEEHKEQIDTVKSKAKGYWEKGKEKLGGIANALANFGDQISTKFDSTLTVGKSTLAQIAEKQLEVQQTIMLMMRANSGVIGKLDKDQLEQLNKATMGAKLDLRSRGQKIRDAAFGFFKRNLWDRPLQLAGGTLRAGKNLAQGFLTNRIDGVYRAPYAGEIFGSEHLLISADDIKKGVFFDPEQKERVKSIQDINRPVFDGKGNPLITMQDIKQGLVDKSQKPIRTFFGTVGRFGRNRVGDVYGAGKWALGKTKDFVTSNQTIQTMANAVTTPFRTASAFFKPWTDVYRKDEIESGPIALARDFERGLLVYEDGKKPRDVYSIKRPVMWANDPKKLAITWEDIDHGLVDKYNKPLQGMGFKAGSLVRGAIGLVGKGANLLFGGLGSIAALAGKVVTGTAKFLFKGKNPYIDVYVPEKDGTIPIGKPRLTGQNIKLGKYVYRDGSRVTSAYGIHDAVLETSTGNVLITEEEVHEGVYSIDGKKLTRFAGKSIAGKALAMGLGAAKRGLKGIGKGLKFLGKGILKGAKFLTKGLFDTGSDILGYMHGQMMDILDTVFQRDTVKKVDLEVIVGKRLDKIYDAIKMLLPKNIAGDIDNDGDRDGGYKDQEQKRKERRERLEAKKAQKRAEEEAKRNGKGSLAAGALGKEDEGSFLDDAADAAYLWDSMKKSKLGRAVGRGLGKAGRFLGRKLPMRMLKGASGLAGRLGMSGAGAGLRTAAATVGRQGLMMAARTGLMAGGGALMSAAGGAIGSGLAAAGSMAGAGLAAAGTFLVSNPIGWAILAAGAVYGGYKLLSWAFSDSDNEKGWKKTRFEQYGFTDDKYESAILDLEKRTLKILDGEDRELEESEIRDFAKEFGIIDSGYVFGLFGGDEEEVQKEKMEYFTTWYAKRFRPVFELYARQITYFTKRKPGAKLDPDDISKKSRENALKTFKQNAEKILSRDAHNKDLVPTADGYEKYRKMKEQAEKTEETKSATGPGAAAAAAGASAMAKTPEEAMKQELEKKKQAEAKKESNDAMATALTSAKTGKEAVENILKTEEEKNKSPFQNPITDVLAFANPLTAGYKLLSWAFGDSKTTAAWKVLRLDLYGADPKEQEDLIIDLEKRVLKIIDKQSPELTDSDFEELAQDFGIIDKGLIFGIIGGDTADVVKEKLSYFATWYSTRFRPIYETYVRLVRYYTGARPGSKVDPDDIPEKKLQAALQTFKSEAEKLISQIPAGKELKPTLDGYNKYGNAKLQAESQKAREKDEKKKTTPSLAVQAEAADAQRQAMEASKQAREQTTNSAAQAAADAQLQAQIDQAKADKAARGKAPTQYGSSHQGVVDARSLPFQGSLPGMGNTGAGGGSPMPSGGGSFGGGSGGGIGAGASSGGGGGAADASDINVPVIKSSSMPGADGLGDIGEYTKKFESGSEGSTKMAWDRTGGTSYGTYQYAAIPKGVDDFIKWAGKNGGPLGKAFAEAMNGARPWETGSKRGRPTEVWKKFARSNPALFAKMEKIGTYELRYKDALKRISKYAPNLIPIIQGNRGLQEALWSTAIQHGCGGASKIFRGTYKAGISPQQWLRNIYAKRSGSFGSSTGAVQGAVKGRFKEELQIALGLSGQPGIAFGSTAGALNGEAATDPGSAAAQGQGAGGDAGGGGPTPDAGGAGGAGGEGGGSSAGGGAAGGPTPEGVAGQQTPAGSYGMGSLGGSSGSGTPGSMSEFAAGSGGSGGGSTPGSMSEAAAGMASGGAGAGAGGEQQGQQGQPGQGGPGAKLDANNIDKSTFDIKISSGKQNFDAVNPNLKARFAGVAKEFYEKTHKKMYVTSGKRSLAHQAHLYRTLPKGKAAKPNPLAPHICGLALDVNYNNQAYNEQAEKMGLWQKYGLYRPLKNGLGSCPKEHWHIEPIGSRDPKAGMRITKQTLAKFGNFDPNVGGGGAKEAGGYDTSADGVASASSQPPAEQQKAEGGAKASGGQNVFQQIESTLKTAQQQAGDKIKQAFGMGGPSGGGGGEASSGGGGESSGGGGGGASYGMGSVGGGAAPDTGVGGGGGGAPAGPTAKTDTPSQSGRIGGDVCADAQLQELKLATQLLGQIKDGVLQLVNPKEAKSDSVQQAPTSMQGVAAQQGTPMSDEIAKAFASDSPAMQSLINVIQTAFSGVNLNGMQTPEGRTDASSMRSFASPLNTTKHAPAMF